MQGDLDWHFKRERMYLLMDADGFTVHVNVEESEGDACPHAEPCDCWFVDVTLTVSMLGIDLAKTVDRGFNCARPEPEDSPELARLITGKLIPGSLTQARAALAGLLAASAPGARQTAEAGGPETIRVRVTWHETVWMDGTRELDAVRIRRLGYDPASPQSVEQYLKDAEDFPGGDQYSWHSEFADVASRTDADGAEIGEVTIVSDSR